MVIYLITVIVLALLYNNKMFVISQPSYDTVEFYIGEKIPL